MSPNEPGRDTVPAAFDLAASINWLSRLLFDPTQAARAWSDSNTPWRATLVQITLPACVAASILQWLLALLFGAGSPILLQLLLLAWSIAQVLLLAFILDFIAGAMGANRDFDRAFAAIALALVPATLLGALSPIPWLGWLISVGATIWSLVLLYQFIGILMTVPEPRRVLHFVASFIAALVLNMVVGSLIAMTAMTGSTLRDFADDDEWDAHVEESFSGATGIFDLDRPIDFAAQASEDTYAPPADGELTREQVRTYVRNLERTADLRKRLSSELGDLQGEDNPDLGKLFSGLGNTVRLGTAEMEVVKSGGGNWAEHQWVRNQIETARIQQEGTAAIDHNYALFLEFQQELERLD